MSKKQNTQERVRLAHEALLAVLSDPGTATLLAFDEGAEADWSALREAERTLFVMRASAAILKEQATE